MKKVKTYSQFIKEAFIPAQDDPPEIASQMNTLNSKEQMIADFQKYKVEINNIYMTYKDENELINRLSKFLMKKTSNKKEIKFKNRLLEIWAESCDKRRDIKNIQNSIEKLDQKSKDSQENIKANPSLKDSEEESIKSNTDEISNKNKSLSQLQKEIMDLEKKVKEELDKLKKDITQSKSKIQMYKTKKTTTSADTTEEK